MPEPEAVPPYYMGKSLYPVSTEFMHAKIYKGGPTDKRYMTSVVNNYTTQANRTTARVENLGGNDLQGVFLNGEVEMLDGKRLWIQTGWHQWGGVKYFTMVFGRGGWVPPSEVQLKNAPILVAGTIHTFYSQIRNGAIYVGMDGEDYAYIPVNASHFLYSAITLESIGTTNRPLNMPSIRFNKAIKIFQNGQWIDALEACLTGSGYKVQVNAPNDVNMGSIKSNIQPYTKLW